MFVVQINASENYKYNLLEMCCYVQWRCKVIHVIWTIKYTSQCVGTLKILMHQSNNYCENMSATKISHLYNSLSYITLQTTLCIKSIAKHCMGQWVANTSCQLMVLEHLICCMDIGNCVTLPYFSSVCYYCVVK